MSRISLVRFLLVWVALLLAGSLLPFNAKLALHTTGDHRLIHPLLHILAFATLGFLGASLTKSRLQMFFALVLVVAFGLALEMIEILAYPHKLEIADVRLDAYGAAVGCLLCAAWKRGLHGKQT
jgi:glycopeptide antibiotics resistance protein